MKRVILAEIMADSKHANDIKLDTFLEDTVEKHLNFPQSNLEVHVVQHLVHKMVNNIVKRAYLLDSGLTVKGIIPVGSMAEGTRIAKPDEFDFMIVLDKVYPDDIAWPEIGIEQTIVMLQTKCRRDSNCVHCKSEVL